MEKSYLTYVATEYDENREVKSVLYEELKLTSRKIRSVKLDPEGILLDGIRVHVREKMHIGQTLKVLLNDIDSNEDHLIPAPMKLDILYEDPYFLYLNKPSGVVCHPSKGHAADSLANGVLWYFNEKNENSSVHLIGRLDKDTSGIVGIAKNAVAAEWINRLKLEGKYYKEYFALVDGLFEDEVQIIKDVEQDGDVCSVRIPMEEYRDEAYRGLLKMRRAKTESDGSDKADGYRDMGAGKQAVTHFEIVGAYKEYALLKLWLESGRMHQIRFHLSEIGHPLLGDSLYNTNMREDSDIHRTALHAAKVSFVHPITGEQIHIEAELPPDMKRFLC